MLAALVAPVGARAQVEEEPEIATVGASDDRVWIDNRGLPQRRGRASHRLDGRMQVLALSFDAQGASRLLGFGMIVPVRGFGEKPPSLPIDGFMRLVVGTGAEGFDLGLDGTLVAHLTTMKLGATMLLLDLGVDVRRTIAGWYSGAVGTVTLRVGDEDAYPAVGLGLIGHLPLASSGGDFARAFLGGQLALNL